MEYNNQASITLLGPPSSSNITFLFLNYYANQVFDHEILGKKCVNYILRQ
jgi:hypothetical protein